MLNRITCAVAFLCAAPVFAAPPPGIERWKHNHHEAARELGEWVKNHPEAAQKFFDWDGHHPERSREFVTWAITHPGDSVDVFVMTHRGWPFFDAIMEKHRPAAEAFIAWCRRHAKAAEALMMHPRGLEWAGHHLLREYWSLEHPRQ